MFLLRCEYQKVYSLHWLEYKGIFFVTKPQKNTSIWHTFDFNEHILFSCLHLKQPVIHLYSPIAACISQLL